MKKCMYALSLVITCMTCIRSSVWAYSVLTHEAIIDATWEKNIVPLLQYKYPSATIAELKEAHAYAYGGCLAPDMGYYPYGSRLFTDLTHYVRTGDFVNALLDEAQNINEYAFAAGVLCHYCADKYGHPIAINHSVPLTYDKDREKYGPVVTYEQDPIAHLRTEFSFDVLQTARGNYASEAYHDFIGFKLSEPLLQRAFLKTYGLHLGDLFKDFTRSTETFRWIVKNFFPTVTKTAWANKRSEIRKTHPTATRTKFEYRMRNAKYNREYGKKRDRPGFFPGTLAMVVKVMPKVGPLKDMKLKIPGPQAEQFFIRSFDTVVVHYAYLLLRLRAGDYRFANVDFDTGEQTSAGEYGLADKAYMDLLLKIRADKYQNVTPALRDNILQYYAACNEKMAASAGSDKWKDIAIALADLRNGHSSR